jgi:hypothetical protein
MPPYPGVYFIVVLTLLCIHLILCQPYSKVSLTLEATLFWCPTYRDVHIIML